MLDRWNKSDNYGLSQRVLDRVKPSAPLKNRIEAAQKGLEKQIDRLDTIHKKLRANSEQMFAKIVEAQHTNNHTYAKIYAGELHNIRKTMEIIGCSKLAMERMRLRLDTISDMGDIVVTLSPCMSVIRGLSPVLSGVMPEASASMQDLTSMLGGLLHDSSVSHTGELVTMAAGASNDAMAIIEEASVKMVSQANTSIPEIPKTLSQNASITTTGTSKAPISQHSAEILPEAPRAPVRSQAAHGTHQAAKRQPERAIRAEVPVQKLTARPPSETTAGNPNMRQSRTIVNDLQICSTIPDVPEELKREIVKKQLVPG